ncbi:Hypp7123 [Branchiostoma lanceolatum]|uniref:Hypp7123 protein n=1 Tax=Branchiostoma lanceolatum TaxID=7740 RepID=A0A8K0E9E1_BRALA|nr:Hypp7123 [Branchiostoma lanceolatum]
MMGVLLSARVVRRKSSRISAPAVCVPELPSVPPRGRKAPIVKLFRAGEAAVTTSGRDSGRNQEWIAVQSNFSHATAAATEEDIMYTRCQ